MTDMKKKQQEEFRAARFGSACPDYIAHRVDDMAHALKNCLPFQPVTEEDNMELLDVVEERCRDLFDYVRRIKSNVYGLDIEETPDDLLFGALVQIADIHGTMDNTKHEAAAMAQAAHQALERAREGR